MHYFPFFVDFSCRLGPRIPPGFCSCLQPLFSIIVFRHCLIEPSHDPYILTRALPSHDPKSSTHATTSMNMTGQIASFPGFSAMLDALSPFSLLARFRTCSKSTRPAAPAVISETLPEPDWADCVDGIRQLFREEYDTGLPPSVVIIFNSVSIFRDQRGRWRDRSTKRFVRGPRKNLEGATLLFYGQKVVPAGFGENRWRGPETGRFVKGPVWSPE
jgi:hypothetical protein